MKHLNAICCCKRLAAAGKQFCKAVRREYLLNPPLLIKVEALALLRREDKGNGDFAHDGFRPVPPEILPPRAVKRSEDRRLLPSATARRDANFLVRGFYYLSPLDLDIH
jgi:hypothetical protein